MPFLRLVCVVLGALAVSWLPSAAQPSEPASTVSLVTGTLPNGLAYAILPYPSVKGDIGLRLIVNAGSLDERDDERGFAHFVEHMAFQGTRHHPPGSVRQFFQNLGLNFGADLNASTSYTHTQYNLDLPDGRADQLDESLQVLRDYADGLLFPPEQVSREAGVVVSEIMARDSASRRTGTQIIDTLFAGTPLPEREVGGVSKIIEQATPDQLRAFYQRNYLPGRMTVVLVGPIDANAAVAAISQAFESMPAPATNAPAAPMPVPLSSDVIKPHVITVPTAKGVSVQFSHNRPRAPDTVEGHRQELAQRVATAALSLRLRQRREREDVAKFSSPRVTFEPMPFGHLAQHRMEISSTSSTWTDAVALMESELRTARERGFTQADIDEAAAGQLNYAQNRVRGLGSQSAAGVALEIARQIVAGRSWLTPAQELAETKQALKEMTAEEVTREIERLFPSNSLDVLLLVPPDTSIRPERLLAAYSRSAERTVKTQAPEKETLRFRYEDFGQPGGIAKREREEALDITMVSFANDVRLNLRPTTFEPERFRMRIVFPQNYSDVPTDLGGISDLAGHVILNSDLRRHPLTEITRVLRVRGVSPGFSVNNGTPVFTATGPSTELRFALQFLTALLSDLQLDSDHYRVALSRYSGQRQGVANNPAPFALRAALFSYTGQDRRLTLTPPQAFANERGFDATSSWLREYILNGPLEIGIVGDIAVDDAITSAAATVGTLKKRRAPKPGKPLSSPTKPVRQAGSADLPASVSVSCVLWPVTTTHSARDKAALALAADVLRDRQMGVLREILGATYTPNVRVYWDAVQPDFGFVSLINTFEPAKAQELAVVSLSVSVGLAEKGVTAEEFTRLREPALARGRQDKRNNGWWVNGVAIAQSRPEVMEEMREHESILDAMTLEDVNRAAQVFNFSRVTNIVLHPKSANVPPVKRGEKTPKKSDDSK